LRLGKEVAAETLPLSGFSAANTATEFSFARRSAVRAASIAPGSGCPLPPGTHARVFNGASLDLQTRLRRFWRNDFAGHTPGQYSTTRHPVGRPPRFACLSHRTGV
jgi:hypothetical protein